MKSRHPAFAEPTDAAARRDILPVVCYPVETLPSPDLPALQAARANWEQVDEVVVPARDARCFDVPATSFASPASRVRRSAT